MIRTLRACVENTNFQLPHHVAFWEAVNRYIPPGALEDDGALGRIWTSGGTTQFSNPLPVPWYSQRDSGTNQAARMCFSSSCAMLLEYLKPGTLKGVNGDDQYLKRVQQFGDTTSVDAQIKALKSYGVSAAFSQSADFDQIKQSINRGVPVPCGFIHRGPVNDPTGGGHWLIIIGYTAKGVIVHDPWGESDLLSGGTVSANGRGQHYSYQNFGRRWMVELVNGRYVYRPGKGWAVFAQR